MLLPDAIFLCHDPGMSGLPSLTRYLSENDETVVAFARRSGISLRAVHCLMRGEVGDPKLSTLIAISRASGIPLDTLAQELEEETFEHE